MRAHRQGAPALRQDQLETSVAGLRRCGSESFEVQLRLGPPARPSVGKHRIEHAGRPTDVQVVVGGAPAQHGRHVQCVTRLVVRMHAQRCAVLALQRRQERHQRPAAPAVVQGVRRTAALPRRRHRQQRRDADASRDEHGARRLRRQRELVDRRAHPQPRALQHPFVHELRAPAPAVLDPHGDAVAARGLGQVLGARQVQQRIVAPGRGRARAGRRDQDLDVGARRPCGQRRAVRRGQLEARDQRVEPLDPGDVQGHLGWCGSHHLLRLHISPWAASVAVNAVPCSSASAASLRLRKIRAACTPCSRSAAAMTASKLRWPRSRVSL